MVPKEIVFCIHILIGWQFQKYPIRNVSALLVLQYGILVGNIDISSFSLWRAFLALDLLYWSFLCVILLMIVAYDEWLPSNQTCELRPQDEVHWRFTAFVRHFSDSIMHLSTLCHCQCVIPLI
jgi:hypothetical protein